MLPECDLRLLSRQWIGFEFFDLLAAQYRYPELWPALAQEQLEATEEHRTQQRSGRPFSGNVGKDANQFIRFEHGMDG